LIRERCTDPARGFLSWLKSVLPISGEERICKGREGSEPGQGRPPRRRCAGSSQIARPAIVILRQARPLTPPRP